MGKKSRRERRASRSRDRLSPTRQSRKAHLRLIGVGAPALGIGLGAVAFLIGAGIYGSLFVGVVAIILIPVFGVGLTALGLSGTEHVPVENESSFD